MHNPLKMVTPDQLDRRTVLNGVTLGAGAVLLQPFLQRLEAEQAGQAPPKRLIFFLQGNGLGLTTSNLATCRRRRAAPSGPPARPP